MGWQDISTAPKDGTRFLGKLDGDVCPVFWHPGFESFVTGFNRMTLAPGYTYDNPGPLHGVDAWGRHYHDHSPQKVSPTGWIPEPAEEPRP